MYRSFSSRLKFPNVWSSRLKNESSTVSNHSRASLSKLATTAMNTSCSRHSVRRIAAWRRSSFFTAFNHAFTVSLGSSSPLNFGSCSFFSTSR
ncbi:hypothetical protein PF003_g4340 [Phytophthora fragariae]|nr:hypothetical protein PF003_g4340 [Phytophthora fragariae]